MKLLLFCFLNYVIDIDDNFLLQSKNISHPICETIWAIIHKSIFTVQYVNRPL